MIITVEDLRSIKEYRIMDTKLCISKIKAVEGIVRSYTNNNFQNRMIRFIAESGDGMLMYCHPFIREGDTLQISESPNKGLYTVQSTDNCIELCEDVYPCVHNLVTKVEYPEDVKAGVMALLEWESKNRKKVGIKSETISRHSVTYYDQDASNTVMGYPVSLMAFLEPYMKPRF